MKKGTVEVSWRSIKYMMDNYGGSYSYWSKRVHYHTIPYAKPTGGRVLIDETYYIKECNDARVEPKARLESIAATL